MRILRSLYYWVIALGYFGPVLFILILRTFIQKPERYDPWLRRRVITLFKILGSEPRVEFAETIPQDRPLIFMANHSSLLDIPLMKAVIPLYFIGIVAHDQMDYFLYGPAVRRIGSIPIHRDNIRLSLKSFAAAKKLLDRGIHITVLPEGSRSKDGLLLPFKKLPFRFARESGASIVPIAISGVFSMKNKGSLHLYPGQIHVRFGPVIQAEKIANLDIDDLMELTRKRISSRLEPFEAGQ
ncbi:MAG: lysophospholipid acyltransferase family protein [Candidatus Marinimicrobia bacterium]|nr:lysophospholipid acyltransferase family protein [Candidatus Neomarinimicrobiota bacterium]